MLYLVMVLRIMHFIHTDVGLISHMPMHIIIFYNRKTLEHTPFIFFIKVYLWMSKKSSILCGPNRYKYLPLWKLRARVGSLPYS